MEGKAEELTAGRGKILADRLAFIVADLPGGCSMREKLLAELVWFVQAAGRITGVRKVGLLGSITTNKENPKDIDFLVTVDDNAGLQRLAKLGRKLKGHAQQFGRGADIFLQDVEGSYIGRTCSWKECRPGIRMSCHALHCGRRPYLYDDLQKITLSNEMMKEAVELWPSVEHRVGLPQDLLEMLQSLVRGE